MGELKNSIFYENKLIKKRLASLLDSKTLLLETNFKFHKDKLSEIKTREILENALREVTRKNVNIEVMLKPAFAKALAGDGR